MILTNFLQAKMPKAAQPKTLATELHDFQLQGLHWLLEKESPTLPAEGTDKVTQLWQRSTSYKGAFKNIATQYTMQNPPSLASGGILADDMGLGKTIQVISLIMADRELGRQAPDASNATLILAPVSVMSNWSTQMERHIKPEHALRIMFYHGTRKQPLSKKTINNYDVVISTYDSVSSEWHSQKTPQIPRSDGVFSVKWRRVILDEGKSTSARAPKTEANVSQVITFGTPKQRRALLPRNSWPSLGGA
jgi:SWI/SNF-related matrix-associated actin-dependent regulator of chromatin subfamily A3